MFLSTKKHKQTRHSVPRNAFCGSPGLKAEVSTIVVVTQPKSIDTFWEFRRDWNRLNWINPGIAGSQLQLSCKHEYFRRVKCWHLKPNTLSLIDDGNETAFSFFIWLHPTNSTTCFIHLLLPPTVGRTFCLSEILFIWKYKFKSNTIQILQI